MRNGRYLVIAAVLLLVAGGLIWWLHRPEAIPSKPGAGAPALGSCWNLDGTAARNAFPWPGTPVACTAPHTAEVYYLGQVDHDLIRREHSAKGDDKRVLDATMYASARHTCGSLATQYLGGSWHDGQVAVVANWVNPVSEGFFGCALAQVADPGGQKLTARTASLEGALSGAEKDALAVGCVDSAGGYVACDQPHRSEYVGTYTVTPANAPFDATALASAVTTGCTQLVQSYLGAASGPARADVTVAYVGPTTAADWAGSDQTYACYAKTAVDVRGSIRNLGTRPLPT